MLKKYRDYILLLLIVLLGAFLRFHHFNLSVLWHDETYVVNILSNNFLNLWQATFTTANNPTFTYSLKIWTELFGASIDSLRFLSVFFGLLSIVFIYYLGKLLFGNKAGLWASFLLSVSYGSIFHSIQVRPYSLLLLLTILSYYFFSQIVLRNDKKRSALLYILFTTLGLYVHPWFFFLLPAQFFTAIIINRAALKKILIAQILCFIFSMPLLIELWIVAFSGQNNWIALPTLETFLLTFKYFVYGAQGSYILIILFTLVYILYKRIKIERANLLIAVNLLVIPLFFGFFISKIFPMYYPGRHELETLIGFILILSCFFSKIKNKLFVLTIIVVLTFFAYSLAIKEKQGILLYKTDEKRASEFLAENVGEADLLILTSLNKNVFNYYLPLIDKTKNFHKLYFPIYSSLTSNSNKGHIEDQDELLEKSSEYILGVIRNNKFENIWVAYDSNNPFEQKFVNNLRTELSLVNNYSFIRTDKFFLLDSAMPMFFDRIERYKD